MRCGERIKKSYSRLKSNFDRLLLIFFITQIHRVRFVSVNGEASRVKPSKKNLKTKMEKKCWKKNFEKKNCEKHFEKKMLEKKSKKKFWNKKFEIVAYA